MFGLRSVALMVAITLQAGCAQAPSTPIDSPNAQQVLLAFSATRGPKIDVGDFLSSARDTHSKNFIDCRGKRRYLRPPGGGSFAWYIRQRLIDQFTIAPGYADDSSIRLEGYVDRIDASSLGPGRWEIDMTFWAEGVAPFKVNSVHHFPIRSFHAEIACPIVQGQLYSAVDDLLARLVVHPSFKQILAGPK